MPIGWKEIEIIQTILYNLCGNWYNTSPIQTDITYSSHSMFVAFSLLYFGSSNTTKLQLGNAFGFSKLSDETLKEILLELIHHNKEASDIIVQIVNGIWLSETYPFKEDYKKLITSLECQINNVNFGESEKVRQDINKFVEDATHNIIKEFLQPGTITSLTVSVIVNAIYFKGEWQTPFDLMNEKLLFNSNQQVDGMRKKISAGAIFNENYTSVNIPYKDMEHSMVIIMPENEEYFKNEVFGKSNDYSLLKEIFTNTRQEMSEKRLVTIPKFKIESSFIMNEQLQKMGIIDAFSNNADFSLMSDSKISISNAIHKCVVDVDEKGTEAAAATGIMMMRNMMPMMPPRDVIINKSFYFAIIGGEMNIPLFFGQITHPQH